MSSRRREQITDNCRWLFNREVQIITFVVRKYFKGTPKLGDSTSRSPFELHYYAVVLPKECSLKSLARTEIEDEILLKAFHLLSSDGAISTLLEKVEEKIGTVLDEDPEDNGRIRISSPDDPSKNVDKQVNKPPVEHATSKLVSFFPVEEEMPPRTAPLSLSEIESPDGVVPEISPMLPDRPWSVPLMKISQRYSIREIRDPRLQAVQRWTQQSESHAMAEEPSTSSHPESHFDYDYDLERSPPLSPIFDSEYHYEHDYDLERYPPLSPLRSQETTTKALEYTPELDTNINNDISDSVSQLTGRNLSLLEKVDKRAKTKGSKMALSTPTNPAKIRDPQQQHHNYTSIPDSTTTSQEVLEELSKDPGKRPGPEFLRLGTNRTLFTPAQPPSGFALNRKIAELEEQLHALDAIVKSMQSGSYHHREPSTPTDTDSPEIFDPIMTPATSVASDTASDTAIPSRQAALQKEAGLSEAARAIIKAEVKLALEEFRPELKRPKRRVRVRLPSSTYSGLDDGSGV